MAGKLIRVRRLRYLNSTKFVKWRSCFVPLHTHNTDFSKMYNNVDTNSAAWSPVIYWIRTTFHSIHNFHVIYPACILLNYTTVRRRRPFTRSFSLIVAERFASKSLLYAAELLDRFGISVDIVIIKRFQIPVHNSNVV